LCGFNTRGVREELRKLRIEELRGFSSSSGFYLFDQIRKEIGENNVELVGGGKHM
jgi:hypothetical protein